MPITLLYHDVVRAGREDSSGFVGAGAARYKLTLSEFQSHLAHLDQAVSAAPTVTTADPTWQLTFDDGGVSAATCIADALDSRNWKGWFFITTHRIGTPGFVSRTQILDLHQRGHVIGTHTCSHPHPFSQVPLEQQSAEWRDSRRALEDILGAAVTTGSVPGGAYSDAVGRIAAEAGLRTLFNSEPTTTIHRADQCDIQGRYTIYRGMTALQAAALLESPWSRRRQSFLWSAKKLAKSAGGATYLRLRETLLRRAYAPAS